MANSYRHRRYLHPHERRRTYREHVNTKPAAQSRAFDGKAATAHSAKGALSTAVSGLVMPTAYPGGNTGPDSTNGSISAAQFIADGGASHKIIVDQVSDQGGNAFLGRTFNADHCIFQQGIYYYANGFPTNIPTFNLSRCAIYGQWFFFSAVKGTIDHCYADNGAFWVSDPNEAARDHSDAQIGVSWQGIQITNTMFHQYVGDPFPSFHVEAQHLVGANHDMTFSNVRWCQDGPANINTTATMKHTSIDSQYSNCWWDWNGQAAGANFTIYIEGRNIQISGKAQEGYGAGQVSGTGYVFDGIWSPDVYPFTGTPVGAVNQYVIPNMSNVKDWDTNVSIGRGW